MARSHSLLKFFIFLLTISQASVSLAGESPFAGFFPGKNSARDLSFEEALDVFRKVNSDNSNMQGLDLSRLTADSIIEKNNDTYSNYFKVNQKINNLDVFNGELRIHTDPYTGKVVSISGNQINGFTGNTNAKVPYIQANILAQYALKNWLGKKNFAFPFHSQKVIYDSERLAWKIRYLAEDMKSYKVLLDAQRGEVLEIIPEVSHLHDQNVYSADNFDFQGFMGQMRAKCAPQPKPAPKTPSTSGTTSSTGTGATVNPCTPFYMMQMFMALQKNVKKKLLLDKGEKPKFDAEDDLKNVFNHTDKVSKYFKNTFKRNSYDNKGAMLTSSINIGVKWNNAVWMPAFQMMMYGNGDGTVITSMTKSIEVIGHELTHAVVSFTSKLTPINESGALNESFADFFGKMVSRSNSWKLGEENFNIPGKSVRDMINPMSMNHPDHMGRKLMPLKGACAPQNDYCFVHRNAGIPNKAAALYVEAVGRNFAEKVYYKTLTEFLHSKSTFIHAATSLFKSCHMIARAEKLDAESLCNKELVGAWNQVGINMVPTNSSNTTSSGNKLP